MKEVVTKIGKVKKTTYTCDVCGKKIEYLNNCDVCGRDLCSDHAGHHAGDILPVQYAGNYTCCHNCDKKLEHWRKKLNDLKSEYDIERVRIIKEFKEKFGLN